MAIPEPGTILLTEIRQTLLARYGNLAEPWYGWVLPAYEAAPYKAVVDDLVALGAAVEDDTDLNDDVSCRYLVRRDGILLIAELSLAGPFAVVSGGEGKTAGPITPDMPVSGLARDVLEALESHGLRVLDAATLRMPVEMPFQNVEAGQGTLYQALVSDTPSPFGTQAQRRIVRPSPVG